MQRLSERQLIGLTGFDRATVSKRLDGLPFDPGPRRAKLYDSTAALAKIYQRGGDDPGGFVDQAEAQRLLTLKRGEQIDLEMEVTRKERIPLDVLEAANDRVFSNVAGMLKAHEGKTLSAAAIGDMLGELRSVSEAVRRG